MHKRSEEVAETQVMGACEGVTYWYGFATGWTMSR